MATRSQAPKPAGKLVSRKETARPHCGGGGGTYSTGSIRRVKTLLLCLTVGLWGCPSPAGTCHSGVSQQQGLF